MMIGIQHKKCEVAAVLQLKRLAPPDRSTALAPQANAAYRGR
jgi:hypothetical protein